MNLFTNFRILIISLVLALGLINTPTPVAASAQDDRLDDFTFESEQLEELKQPYFAISAGVTGSLLFMKYDELNKKNSHQASLEEFDSPMFMFGFNIFSALSPFVNNTRVGFSYQAGSKTSEADITLTENTNTEVLVNCTNKLSMQLAGIHFDYAFVPTKSLALLPGVGLKWGTMTFENFSTVLPQSWNTPKNQLTEPNNQMKYSFMAIEPKLDIEYALTGFLMLRASAGYILAFDNPLAKHTWTINGNNELTDVPKSIKPQGFSLQFGLFLGLLNY